MLTNRSLLFLLFLSLVFGIETGAEEHRPLQAFARLNGTWVGSFVGYDNRGEELYRIRVKQMYQILNRTTQRVEIEDLMSDGTKVTGISSQIQRRSGRAQGKNYSWT